MSLPRTSASALISMLRSLLHSSPIPDDRPASRLMMEFAFISFINSEILPFVEEQPRVPSNEEIENIIEATSGKVAHAA